MTIIVRGIRFVWPFFRYFAVGFAWGLPFILLIGANSNFKTGTARMLAEILESLTFPYLFLIPPLFATVGVLLVKWLSKQVAPLSRLSMFALLLPIIIAVVITFLVTRDLPKAPWTFSSQSIVFLTILLGFETPILGAIITANAIWRRNRWLAIAWVVGYVLIVWGLTRLSKQTMSAEKDMGAGIFLAIAINILLGVSIIASLIAFIKEMMDKHKFTNQNRLASECEKLDPSYEKALAEKGLNDWFRILKQNPLD